MLGVDGLMVNLLSAFYTYHSYYSYHLVLATPINL